eukprot:12511755-Alexandrium_andersonii.AAC.1
MSSADRIPRNGSEDPARECGHAIELAQRVETLSSARTDQRRALGGEARRKCSGGDQVLHCPLTMRPNFVWLIAHPDQELD